MPTACAAIPIRPPSSVAIATGSRGSPRRAAGRAGTSASIARSAVDDELRPSFSSSRVTSTCAASSTNAETPRAPACSGSVRAKSRNVPANAPFVIHCFVPVIRQPSSVALRRRDERAGVRARRRARSARTRRSSRRARAAARSARAARRCRTRAAAACTRACAPRPSPRRPRRRARAPRARGCTRGSPRRRRRRSSGTQTPISPSSASRPSSSRGKRVRAVPLRRVRRDLGRRRTRARAPGSRAAPA